jgi:SOS-response transcriptional repressor LexA
MPEIMSCVRPSRNSGVTGAELANFRKNRLRLTQEQMANRLGLTRQTYKNYEYLDLIPDSVVKSLAPLGFYVSVESQSPQPGFSPPAPFADGLSHPKVGRRLFPVLGVAGAAEFPMDSPERDAEDWEEFADALHTDQAERFFVRVMGDSMEDTWEPGDLALVHPNEGFRGSGFYVCVANPDGALLKVLMGKNGRWALVPENSDYDIVPVEDHAWRMVGYVVGLKRVYGPRVYTEHGNHTGLRPRKKVLAEIVSRFDAWLAANSE